MAMAMATTRVTRPGRNGKTGQPGSADRSWCCLWVKARLVARLLVATVLVAALTTLVLAALVVTALAALVPAAATLTTMGPGQPPTRASRPDTFVAPIRRLERVPWITRREA
jgi:hypothetical protein